MAKAVGFIGFPDSKMRPVIIPDHFFTDLLPQIDDLAELKLTLHCFWLLNEQSGTLRYLRGDALREDEKLLASLSSANALRPPLETLGDALERAVARNTLLRLDIMTNVAEEIVGEAEQSDVERTKAAQSSANLNRTEDQNEGQEGKAESLTPNPDQILMEDWYFVNTVKGRQTIAMIRQGKIQEIKSVLPEEARLHVERPNIFILYEQNISTLTPLIADQLRDMEKSYPPEWVQEAFEIAVVRNKRALRYIQAILKRWETEGKTDGPNDGEGKGYGTYKRNSQNAEQDIQIPEEYADVILR